MAGGAPARSATGSFHLISLLLAWGPAVLWAVGLVLLSSWSSPPTLGLSPAHLDKPVHFGMYAVLGGALAWGHHREGRPAPWILLAGGILFGVTDELHQAFVPRREPSVADLVADTLGLLAGYAVVTGLLSRVAPGRDGAPGEGSP